MKKIILVIALFFSINLYATQKAECEKLFKSAIYNFYLENSCKFNKHISSAIRKEFDNQGCTKMFNDDDMKKLNSEVLGDSYQKMNKIGRDKFCKNNKVTYNELEKIYLKNSH